MKLKIRSPLFYHHDTMKNSSIELSEFQKQAFISKVSDGLSELFQASLLLISALIFINIYTEFLFAFLVIGISLQWPRLQQHLKEKFIYPRIGFVSLRKDHQKRIKIYWGVYAGLLISIIGVFFALVFAYSLSIAETFKFIPFVIALPLFGRFFYFYYFGKNIQNLLGGLLTLLIALIIFFIPFTWTNWYIITYLLIVAGILGGIGIWKFRIFIKTKPIINE